MPASSSELTGHATGAQFSTSFGALWIFLAIYAAHRLSLLAVLLLLAGAALLLAGVIALRRRAASLPQIPENPEMRLAFNRVKAFEWLAIFISVFLLIHWRLELYIPSAITAIVGLQFFPMARIFGTTLHYLTGSAFLGWAAISLIFAPPTRLMSIVCAGSGVILWLSALLSLALGFRLAQETDDALA